MRGKRRQGRVTNRSRGKRIKRETPRRTNEKLEERVEMSRGQIGQNNGEERGGEGLAGRTGVL